MASDVEFCVKCETKLGTNVFIAGNIDALGKWEKPIKLSCDNYPMWNITIAIPALQETQFKFIRMGGDTTEWEIGANRVLAFQEGKCKITTFFNSSELSIEYFPVAHVEPISNSISFEFPISDESNEPSSVFTKAEKMTLNPKENIVFVAHLLPIHVDIDSQKNVTFSNSKRIIYPALMKFAESSQYKNIKWVGLVKPVSIPEECKGEINSHFAKKNFQPLYIEQEILKSFNLFLDTILLPLFHDYVSISDFYKYMDNHLWKAYKQVNKAFADQVYEVCKGDPNSLIWIHDIPLLLVPKYLKKKMPNAYVGIFLHSPFPSSELYKIFPERNKLLNSMLNADIIGFHLYEYARHFITCCHRLLSLNTETRGKGQLGVIVNGRTVTVRIGHIGLNEAVYREMASNKEFIAQFEKKRKFSESKILMASIDRLSPLSGLIEKLNAFEKVLASEMDRPIVLTQYILPSSEADEALKESVINMANKINKEHPGSVDLIFEAVSIYQRLALLARADILLITSRKEGFCLIPFEFYLIKKFINDINPNICPTGVVVISEFTGCSSALSGLLRVNPYSIEDIGDKIRMALVMSEEEKLLKAKNDENYIISHSIDSWVTNFLISMKEAHLQEGAIIFLGKSIANHRRKMGDIKRLDIKAVVNKYKESERSLLLFDNEGTIIPQHIHKHTLSQSINPQLLNILATLTQNPATNVFVVSGRDQKLMESWYKALPQIGLGAEHGYFTWWPNKGWDIKNTSCDWIKKAEDIMASYTARTDGSYIEIKESSIAWVYKESDSELGVWQADELMKQLHSELDSSLLHIMNGKSYVEVRYKNVNKGALSYSVIRRLVNKSSPPLSFVLAIGDDTGDEYMFYNLKIQRDALIKEKMITPNSIITCTVGYKPTYADFYVEKREDIDELLKSLAS